MLLLLLPCCYYYVEAEATTGTNYFKPAEGEADEDYESEDDDEEEEADRDDVVGQVMGAWRRAQRFDNESVGFVIVFCVFAVWLYSIGVNLLAFVSASFWIEGAQRRVRGIAEKLQAVAAALSPMR